MDLNPVDIVKEYWSRMQTNDFALVAELFDDDYILEWPQSRERIRGKANFIAVNADYPAQGSWQFTIHDIVGDDQKVVTDVTVTDGTIKARAVTFTTVRHGKIIKQVEYWPEEYPAPGNRKHLVEIIKKHDE